MRKWIVSGAELIGSRVHVADGREIGRIDDVMLDIDDRRLTYFVLSLDRWVREGREDHLIVAPSNLLRIDAARGGDGWLFDVALSRLESAPSFRRDRWPNFADPQFTRDVYRHYGLPLELSEPSLGHQLGRGVDGLT